MQQNIEFERCIDFLVRMLDKYGDEVLRELEEEKQNKEEKTAQNTSERVWLRMFWRIDRTFKMTYTKLSDRSVETCEAYRRGRTCEPLPLFLLCKLVRFY